MPPELILADRGRQTVLHSPHAIGPRPRRLVYVVPHFRAWFVYPLSDGDPPVRHNRQEVRARFVLNAGDQVDFGGRELTVTSASVDGAPWFEPGEGPTACRIIVPGLPAIVADDQALIGTAEHCDCRLPEGPGYEPTHALVARVEDRWVLYDLTGARALLVDGAPVRWVAVCDGDEFSVGALTVGFEILHARAGDRHEQEGNTPIGTGAVETRSDATSVPLNAIEAPVPDGDPLETLVSVVCVWLGQAIRNPATVQPLSLSNVAGTMGASRGWFFGPGDPVAELRSYARQLAQRPHDRLLLTRFAGFLHDRGYRKQYRLVLKQLYALNRNDPAVVMAVIEAFLEAGCDKTLSREERRESLGRAEKYLNRAFELKGATEETIRLRETIAAERTILELSAGLKLGTP